MRWYPAMLLVASLGACYRQPAPNDTCAITCDGSCPDGLACTNGYCVAPGQTCAPSFREVHAGNGFACALDERDLLWCWGSNQHHQLAADDRATVPTVTRTTDRTFDTIATGGGQICGLHAGRLWCWGANDRGQVSGTVVGDVAEPLEIPPPTAGATWTYVAAGYNATCAIAGGHLYCWGAGDTGQLGNGSTNDVGAPTPVTTDLADWTSVSINAARMGGTDIEDVGGTMPGTPWGHACAISTSGGLYCWGAGTNGELGDGTLAEHDTPVAVALPAAPAEVSVGAFSTCAIAAEQLYCWGNAGSQALGDPAVTTSELAGAAHAATPILASSLTGWTHVEAAEELACALRGDEVWCWGTTRGGGGLADGVWGARDWKQVATGAHGLSVGWNAAIDDIGYDHGDLDLGCMLDAQGIACWGDNRFAQLAQGAGVMAATPHEIAGSHHWSLLRAGGNHACGIADGQLLCWGSTIRGEATGVVSGTAAVPCGSAPDLPCDVGGPTALPFAPSATSVALGRSHGCALAGSSLTCWGDNARGQLATAEPAPIAPVAGTWTSLLDTGSDAQCARQGNETFCWGSIMTGAAAGPAHVAALDGLSSLGVGGWFDGSLTRSFGCALDGTMQLVCYGDNFRGEFGNGDQTGASCGNLVCDAGETTDTCPGDCGPAPLTHLARMYRAISVGHPTDHLYYDGIHYNVTAYACGITLDQHVECWGRNFRGQMGVDPGAYPHQVTTPSRIAGLDSCTVISASDYHACAICGGDVKCWGDHRYGGVGAGPITNTVITAPRTIDVALDSGDSWAELVSGVGFSCARTQMGRAYCWGFSPHGALGTGATSSPLPIRVKI